METALPLQCSALAGIQRREATIKRAGKPYSAALPLLFGRGMRSAGNRACHRAGEPSLRHVFGWSSRRAKGLAWHPQAPRSRPHNHRLHVGSGELIATPKVGAEYGFSLLWFIIAGCMIKVLVQVELGRFATPRA